MTQENQFPAVEPAEAMKWSYNITAFTMLRNLIGTSVQFGDTLRRLAYRSNIQHRPFRILEVTYGLPSIAMELFSPHSFRSNGDFLQYYIGSPNLDDITVASYDESDRIRQGFEPPQIHITAVSPRDYLLDLLSGNNHRLTKRDVSHVTDRLSAILYQIEQRYTQDTLETLKRKYQDAKSNSRINVFEGDLVSSLSMLSQRREKYDLVVCNQFMYSPDRIRLFEALQSVISEGGISYIPLTWWSPALEGGIDEGTLLADVIHIDGRDLPVERYLAENYPDAFEVKSYPGVNALIVKGTPNPVKLPLMTAEIIKPHISDEFINNPHYYPDMPILRWKLKQ